MSLLQHLFICKYIVLYLYFMYVYILCLIQYIDVVLYYYFSIATLVLSVKSLFCTSTWHLSIIPSTGSEVTLVLSVKSLFCASTWHLSTIPSTGTCLK